MDPFVDLHQFIDRSINPLPPHVDPLIDGLLYIFVFPMLVDFCLFFLTAVRLRAFVGGPIDHKGYKPLWKSPANPKTERPSTTFAFLFSGKLIIIFLSLRFYS